jgi:DNA processing protein
MVGFTGHNSSAEASTTLGMIGDFQLTPWLVNAVDGGYPPALRALRNPPARLWGLGLMLPPEARVLAVVGSRGVSRAGCQIIEGIAAELAGASRLSGGAPVAPGGGGDGGGAPGAWAIVSGGALGIDAAAHRGALAAGGRTWAVLGCGIDVLYPDRHAELFERIRAHGGLLSEYGPGVQPRAGQFPARNRIVAALGRAVLVGEARQGSGALITARLAAKLGRPIFAVPGSFGTDALIESGKARPVETAADVLAGLAGRELGKLRQVSRAATDLPPGMNPELRALVTRLWGKRLLPDVIASQMGWPLGRTLGILSEAELAGWVSRGPGGKFEVNLGD